MWDVLKQAGWQVRLARFVVDADPSLRGNQPRGWPAGMTWEHTDGVHLANRRLLVFAEQRLDKRGQVVTNSRVEGVMRHEIGHAVDVAFGGQRGYASSRPEFVTAYARDVANLRADDHRALAYYLQDHTAGRQEAFAEAFAMLLGGGSDPTQAERFERAFPNVLSLVRRFIEKHSPEKLAAG